MSASAIDLTEQDQDLWLTTDTEASITDDISEISISDCPNCVASIELEDQHGTLHVIRDQNSMSRAQDRYARSMSRTISAEPQTQPNLKDTLYQPAKSMGAKTDRLKEIRLGNLKRTRPDDMYYTSAEISSKRVVWPQNCGLVYQMHGLNECVEHGSHQPLTTPAQHTSGGPTSQHKRCRPNRPHLIVIDEDEEPGFQQREYQKLQRKAKEMEAKRSRPVSKVSAPVEVISDDEGENVNDNAPFSELPVSLEIDDEIEIVRVNRRNSNNASAEIQEIEQIYTNQYKCDPGMCIEFQDGEFMRIQRVIEDRDRVKWIVGHLLLRHNEFNDAKWPRRHNELVHIVRIKKGSPAEWARKPLNQARRNRDLIFTNESFPAVSWKTHLKSYSDLRKDMEKGPLFCRWRQTHVIDQAGKIVEESIERISYTDADPGGARQPGEIQLKWRRISNMPGGYYRSYRPQMTENGPWLEEIQQYTFGDTFCGGGGASCAADEAGLYVEFGVDLNEKAMETYKLNFAHKGTRCILKDIHDFIAECVPGKDIVDVLHISPPCQPFSPAHTVPNMTRDEINQACMFACGELISILKPRVVTLEETYGLFNRHKVWFNALVKMFLDCGYSVRWTGAKLEQFGLPQKRRRLLMIAAGPGEVLPPLPEITHSEVQGDGLKPLATIGEVIGHIPSGSSITHHDIAGATYDRSQWKAPYSAHTQAKTITCSGGIGNYHPSGKRNFTNRELATLQKFPLTYKFADCNITDLRRQIGNAVPPLVFKKIYREIIKSLKKTDGVL